MHVDVTSRIQQINLTLIIVFVLDKLIHWKDLLEGLGDKIKARKHHSRNSSKPSQLRRHDRGGGLQLRLA